MDLLSNACAGSTPARPTIVHKGEEVSVRFHTVAEVSTGRPFGWTLPGSGLAYGDLSGEGRYLMVGPLREVA